MKRGKCLLNVFDEDLVYLEAFFDLALKVSEFPWVTVGRSGVE